MIPRTRLCLLLVSVLFLSGCQVLAEKMTAEEIRESNKQLLNELLSTQAPLEHSLTLTEAYARALKYNLDHQLQLLDQDIAREVHGLSQLDLLPSVNAKSTQARRNRETVVDEKLRYSTYELDATWNLLDFGVSYYQARQKSNRALISSLKLQKSAHELIKKTRRAYWRKVAADHLAVGIGPLRKRLEIAIDNAKESERRRLQPPIEVLDTEKSFLVLLVQLNQLEKELSTSDYEFSKLIRTNPFERVQVVEHETNKLYANFSYLNSIELVDYALNQRDDLIIKEYEKRILEDEGAKNLLKLLPGLEFNLAEKYNSNVTYANNYWNEVGLRLTWNLLNLLHYPKQEKINSYQKERKHIEQLALSLSVITQVQISKRRTIDAWNNYRSLSELSAIGERLQTHATATQQVASMSELELIQREADSVIYQVRKYLGYAELEDAAADFYYSLGAKVIPANIHTLDVDEITEYLNKHYLKDNVVSMHTAVGIPLDVVKTEWVAE